MKNTLISLLLLSLQIFAFPQNAKIDSLKVLLNNCQNQTEQIALLVQLSTEMQNEFDSLLPIAEQLIKLARANGDYCAEAQGLFCKANYLTYTDFDTDGALKFHLKALNIRTVHCDKKSIANSYFQIANIYNIKADYKLSYKNYYKSLEIYEELGNTLNTALVYGNIAQIDQSREKYFEARGHYLKCIQIEEDSNDTENLRKMYNAIGSFYQTQDIYDTALFYFNKAMILNKKLDSKSGLANSYNNIGIIYYYEDKIDSCLSYFIKSLNMRKQIGNKKDIAQSLNNIGIFYTYEEYYQLAIKYSEESLELAKENNYKEEICDALNSLYSIYEELKDYKKANENLQLYYTYKDSLFTEKNEKTISELQTKYETVKKEKEIEQKNGEIANQKFILNRQFYIIMGFIIGGILLIIFVFVLYNRIKIINKQKSIILAQKQTVEEKQIEILDSIRYASRIQEAMIKTDARDPTLTPDYFVLFLPKDIVSGDFYWTYEKGDFFYVAVSDCTGHGVPGAMLTMLGIAFLNDIVTRNELISPASILDELRDKILKELTNTRDNKLIQDGMDISVCRINKTTNSVDWAGANNPIYIVTKNNNTINQLNSNPKIIRNKNESLFYLEPDKQPVGYYYKISPFTNHSFQLNHGDLLYIFSDGIADQFGGVLGKKLKYKGFKKILLQHHNLSLGEQNIALEKEFNDWKSSIDRNGINKIFEQIDDVCVIGVKI